MQLSKTPIIILITSIALLHYLERVLVASQPSYPSAYPPVVRHPGTCTFQRSQPACTFSLLCYLAGGVPIEGCGGDISVTCCMLYNPSSQNFASDYSNTNLPIPPGIELPNNHLTSPRLPSSPSSPTSSSPTSPPSSSSLTSSRDHALQTAFHSPSQSHLPSLSSSYDDNKSLDNVYRNTVRRSRPLPSFLNKERHSRNYIGDDVCGKPIAKPTSRIIGGQDAYFGEFPWQVHIKISKHQCGGALVNRYYVVTAAHCVYQAPLAQLSIIIGAHDIEDPRYQEEPPQYFSVTEVKMHPNFRFSASHPDRYDIAVLKLDRAVRYSSNIIPVCLPPNGFKFESWYGVVTGWGKTDPALSNRYGTRLLQKVDVPVINNEECEKWHRTRGINLKIFPEMMCAGYEDGQKDACVGDSGGPMVIFLNGRWALAGITSAGFGCAQSRQPGIYHRVSHTVNWLLANIND